MPVKTVKRGDKWRNIEAETGRTAKNKGGKSADGGGFTDESKAKAQARAINASLKRKGKI